MLASDTESFNYLLFGCKSQLRNCRINADQIHHILEEVKVLTRREPRTMEVPTVFIVVTGIPVLEFGWNMLLENMQRFFHRTDSADAGASPMRLHASSKPMDGSDATGRRLN